ncbi:MAG: AAA family ATPase, partial [Aeriscardovia sp.]|nr:AAA family ATPase [Aeriscardovia sp.]
MPEQITLTQDQQEAMDAIMSFVDAKDKRVFILRGYAGTGKTTLVKEILSELRRRNRGYNLLASTGRAAKVLSDTVEKKTP